mmetsp:Transcript_24630/g.49928  ORF Transcript_24630/g.49928 Transcript_24630/m.49928 type:complete len:145 (-) Transcript_24630:1435-1869(-)
MTQAEREQAARRDTFMRELADRDRREAAEERKEEERAERAERKRQKEEEDEILGCDYTQGPDRTQEEHDCMREVLRDRKQVIKRVPGGPNNLFYCIQRWAQHTGNTRLYGRSVDDLRVEMSDRLLARCRQRAREEEMQKAATGL